MDSEPPPVPNAFLSSPITRFRSKPATPPALSLQQPAPPPYLLQQPAPPSYLLSALSDLQDEGS